MGRSKKERCSLFDCPMSKKGEKMSTPVRQRLMRDFKRQLEDPLARISVAPLDKNIVLEKVVIFVPNDYPKGWRHVEAYAAVHEDFPNKPPTVRFVSRMFHPNIYADGSIYFGHFTESMKYNL